MCVLNRVENSANVVGYAYGAIVGVDASLCFAQSAGKIVEMGVQT